MSIEARNLKSRFILPIHKAKWSVFNYDEIPPGYYYKAMISGPSTQRAWHRLKFMDVLRRIPAGQKRLLDLGCGPGSFLSLVGKFRQDVSAVGADVASSQIEFARNEIAAQFPGERIKFEVLRAEDQFRLPYEDSSFDVVTMIEVVEHLHPFIASESLREVRRILKPDGKLIISTPNYRSLWPFLEFLLEMKSEVKYHEQHINKFTPNSFVKFLESCGFNCDVLSSSLFISPFLSPLGMRFSESVFEMETALKIGFGSLIIAECSPLSDEAFGW